MTPSTFAHVDHDSHVRAHMEFEATLDGKDPNNTDDLTVFDELPEMYGNFIEFKFVFGSLKVELSQFVM